MHCDSLIDFIRYAVMAPSGHNTQPWTFAVGHSEILIQPDSKRRLPVVDPDDHALFMSLGCALENLVIAAETAGAQATPEYFPDDAEPGTIRVQLTEPGPTREDSRDPDPARLFAAIPVRQSTRRGYDGRPFSPAAIAGLEAAAAEPLVFTQIITDRNAVEIVANHAEAACQAQFRDPAFVAELMHWIRFSRKEAETFRDGLAARTMGLPPVPRWLGLWLMRLATGPKREATRTANQLRSASALMVFSVTADTPEAWVRAGRSFERSALWATAEGMKHAHANMPCEAPHVRERLRQALGLPGRPVLLIRLGYAEPMPPAYRRPLEAVIRQPGAESPPHPTASASDAAR
ncbi:hypothetical protein [Aquisalimonas sp.]|uniref:Acg family FMN-binding oxidoreductase n=1 Tax=unclassified Aquisalimonas TaxID=2644645 RepID=UPI0025C4027B|nr:hypothetical protein [Aquisalimonas sp.]